ncbi:hypothetical protein ABIE64_000608 [Thalassospira sp. MBR-102]|jgi:hypothetical protein
MIRLLPKVASPTCNSIPQDVGHDLGEKSEKYLLKQKVKGCHLRLSQPRIAQP